ncbi:unnamed protein product [Closterium sp. NIES-64]|nr:unnamed protein product [Closterium sp. NIES-64]
MAGKNLLKVKPHFTRNLSDTIPHGSGVSESSSGLVQTRPTLCLGCDCFTPQTPVPSHPCSFCSRPTSHALPTAPPSFMVALLPSCTTPFPSHSPSFPLSLSLSRPPSLSLFLSPFLPTSQLPPSIPPPSLPPLQPYLSTLISTAPLHCSRHCSLAPNSITPTVPLFHSPLPLTSSLHLLLHLPFPLIPSHLSFASSLPLLPSPPPFPFFLPPPFPSSLPLLPSSSLPLLPSPSFFPSSLHLLPSPPSFPSSLPLLPTPPSSPPPFRSSRCLLPSPSALHSLPKNYPATFSAAQQQPHFCDA